MVAANGLHGGHGDPAPGKESAQPAKPSLKPRPVVHAAPVLEFVRAATLVAGVAGKNGAVAAVRDSALLAPSPVKAVVIAALRPGLVLVPVSGVTGVPVVLRESAARVPLPHRPAGIAVPSPQPVPIAVNGQHGAVAAAKAFAPPPGPKLRIRLVVIAAARTDSGHATTAADGVLGPSGAPVKA